MEKWILEVKVGGKWEAVPNEKTYEHGWEALEKLMALYPAFCISALRINIYEFMFARIRDTERTEPVVWENFTPDMIPAGKGMAKEGIGQI